MAVENSYNGNNFRFSLYQEKDLISERIFDADCFSAGVRNFVNIKEILPQILNKLQRLLSADEYETMFGFEKDEELVAIYDFKAYKQAMLDLYPDKLRRCFDEQPKKLEHHVNERIMRGTEFKCGLYINNKTIVERMIYINNYNPDVKTSLDLYDVITEICDMITNHLRKSDIKFMFDEQDIMTKFNLNSYQINELTPEKRREFVYRLN